MLHHSLTLRLNSPLVIPDLFKKPYLTGLDGLRALSICIVVLSHLAHTENCPRFLRMTMRFTEGNFGVHIFFVLSGFLITGLLLKEKVSTGSIHLKKFYFRRAIRIIPIFYLYIITVAYISSIYNLKIPGSDFLSAALFIQNFAGGPGGTWLLTHSWSLAIEQQFYLFWPLILSAFKSPYYLLFIFLVIGWYPFLNTLLYLKPHLSSVFAGPLLRNLPAIMFGSFTSIILYKQWHQSFVSYLKNPLVGISLIISWLTYLPGQFHKFGYFSIPFAHLISSFFIAVFLLHLLHLDRDSLLFKIFNIKGVRYLGKISYSLYIWQQLFLIPATLYQESKIWWSIFPINIIVALLIASGSHHFIEKPLFTLKTLLK